MRPPHYAGENALEEEAAAWKEWASMRPPHYAGENTKTKMMKTEGIPCFNEAPALRGGKR